MTTAKDIMKQIKDNDVKFVDLRFTDPKGKLQHVTMDVAEVDEDMFADGVMFDGSSIAGWKAINESDMVLMPDTETVHMDPFFAQSTMVVLCDILDPVSGEAYNRDPRGTAKKAEAYMKSEGIGDTIFVGPEPEFFVFDDVKYKADPYNTASSSIRRTALERRHRLRDGQPRPPSAREGRLLPRAADRFVPGHALGDADRARPDGRARREHHHEVAAAQHELGVKFDALTRNADKMLIYKYVVHQVANAYGKTATFMPKPIFGDNGSGMHVHMSIWKGGKPMFAGNEYAGLSETCLFFIGGIIKHAKAINAFTNPLTNSYKRLVPGYEAPVLLAYSARNRSASCRIPFGSNPKAKRVEIRFPDPGANPISPSRPS